MMARKDCTFPIKCRYILGLKSTNPLKDRGTEVHELVKIYWLTGKLVADLEPYTTNFKRIISQLRSSGIVIQPTAVEFFVDDDKCKGQVDFELMIGNDKCVGEIKTSKPPSQSKMSDIRLELGFYARITGAKWMLALFLGGEGGILFEPVKPALLKRVEKEINNTEELMKFGNFVRVQGRLCEYCDPSVKTLCGMEIISEGMK